MKSHNSAEELFKHYEVFHESQEQPSHLSTERSDLNFTLFPVLHRFLCLAKIILYQKWRPNCSSVLIFLYYLMLMFWVCVWTMVWLVSQVTLKWGNVFLEFQVVIFGCSGVTSPHSFFIVCAWSEVEEITALITAREEKNIHITCIIHWTLKCRFQTITPLQNTYS